MNFTYWICCSLCPPLWSFLFQQMPNELRFPRRRRESNSQIQQYKSCSRCFLEGNLRVTGRTYQTMICRLMRLGDSIGVQTQSFSTIKLTDTTWFAALSRPYCWVECRFGIECDSSTLSLEHCRYNVVPPSHRLVYNPWYRLITYATAGGHPSCLAGGTTFYAKS